MVKRTGQRGVPVIQVDGQIVVGFDRQRLEQLLASSLPRVKLGVTTGDAARSAPAGSPAQGAYVARVREGSLGENAGLRSGDVIVEVDGKAVHTAAELESTIAPLAPGRHTLTVVRAGETVTAVLEV